MRQSVLLAKTRKEAPSEEVALSAKLLIRAGYVNKVMAGVYELLPLGVRSLEKIQRIIREEMNSIGGQEVLLTALQDPEVWKQSGRWGHEASDVWFTTLAAAGSELGLGWTHEEPITTMMRHHIHSYRDLPRYVYQLQMKFRNEKRAKSGIMRTREFLMKDLYSFSRNEEEHRAFYEECAGAYERIFARVGIGEQTFRTFASGGAFSEFSDEFQTLLPVGEDTIYVHKKKKIAINKEVYTDAVLQRLDLSTSDFEEGQQAVEVGNIFTLGTRFSEPLRLVYADESGASVPVFMGSYGIGPARILGVLAELFGSEDALVLPKSVAPYLVHFISFATSPPNRKAEGEGEQIAEIAEAFHEELGKVCVAVLYDDRHEISPGEKLADSDLLGAPYRVVLSPRSLEQGGVEYTNRITNETHIMAKEQCLRMLTQELEGCATC